MAESKDKNLNEIKEKIKNLSLTELTKLNTCINLISKSAYQKHEQRELALIHQFTNYSYSDFHQNQLNQPHKEKQNSRLQLPTPDEMLPGTLTEVLKKRRSKREFSKKKLSLKEFSTLLFYTYGKTKSVKTAYEEEFHYRTAPSAGALFPIELYIVVQNVESIEPGLYNYLPEDHSLKFQINENYREKIVKAGLEQSFLAEASVIFLLVAFPHKLFPKYGIRGYRYILLDAGHIAQNAYFTAEALKLGACEVGAFYDDYLHEIFDFDGENVFIVSFVAIGKVMEKFK